MGWFMIATPKLEIFPMNNGEPVWARVSQASPSCGDLVIWWVIHSCWTSSPNHQIVHIGEWLLFGQIGQICQMLLGIISLAKYPNTTHHNSWHLATCSINYPSLEGCQLESDSHIPIWVTDLRLHETFIHNSWMRTLYRYPICDTSESTVILRTNRGRPIICVWHQI